MNMPIITGTLRWQVASLIFIGMVRLAIPPMQIVLANQVENLGTRTTELATNTDSILLELAASIDNLPGDQRTISDVD